MNADRVIRENLEFIENETPHEGIEALAKRAGKGLRDRFVTRLRYLQNPYAAEYVLIECLFRISENSRNFDLNVRIFRIHVTRVVDPDLLLYF